MLGKFLTSWTDRHKRQHHKGPKESPGPKPRDSITGKSEPTWQKKLILTVLGGRKRLHSKNLQPGSLIPRRRQGGGLLGLTDNIPFGCLWVPVKEEEEAAAETAA